MKVGGKEFFVLRVDEDAEGRVVVVGVPSNGNSIRIGDMFVTRHDIIRTVEDILNERPRPAPINRSEVSLTVVAIDSMRQQLNELSHGVTGALYLVGEGMESVTLNCYLLT